MSISVRDGNFDVVVVAGPNVNVWPSPGMRSLTSLCAEMGLSVGVYGGNSLQVRGVIPVSSTGGVVIVEDAQKRIHRIHARAVVRVSAGQQLPDPFPGSRSEAFLPLATARRLLPLSSVLWSPATIILGSGNAAFRFGVQLLEKGVSDVICMEPLSQWGGKFFSAWEVERRCFEMAGGKLIEATPVSLSRKSLQQWEFRARDRQGVRIFDVARVVAAGPFDSLDGDDGIREYPPASMLFEVEQRGRESRSESSRSWSLDEERARRLAVRLIKGLCPDLGALGEKREKLEEALRRSRARLKRFARHREEPFIPAYEGKWMASADLRKLRAFSGVPRLEQNIRPVASIECIEEIGCNLCEIACPESAIDIARGKGRFLDESKCTGCGICLDACPSSTPILMHERENHSTSLVTLAWRGVHLWKAGETAVLVNRRGDSLGSARIKSVDTPVGVTGKKQFLQIEVPTHLIWEARSVKRPRPPADADEDLKFAIQSEKATGGARAEVTVNGEPRFVQNGVLLTQALFEAGRSRPEDSLFCSDGSCNLCQVTVDGAKKLACRTEVHKGMSVELQPVESARSESDLLCPCMNVKKADILERMRTAKLQSPDAVAEVTRVGEGMCHGQLCMGSFRRLLAQEGVDVSNWIDWRFPWSEWVLRP